VTASALPRTPLRPITRSTGESKIVSTMDVYAWVLACALGKHRSHGCQVNRQPIVRDGLPQNLRDREENRRFWPDSQGECAHRINFCDLCPVGTFFAIDTA